MLKISILLLERKQKSLSSPVSSPRIGELSVPSVSYANLHRRAVDSDLWPLSPEECRRLLTEGADLLRHDGKGSTKKRFFKCSEDLTFISWNVNKKESRVMTLRLRQVT